MDHAPEFEACDKLERLEVFCEYMQALERAERDAKDEARSMRRRQERLNRDAFKQLLEQHRAEGRIDAKTTWKVRGGPVCVVDSADGSAIMDVLVVGCGGDCSETELLM